MGDDRNDDKYKMHKNGWLALAVLLFLASFSMLRLWIFELNILFFLAGGGFVYLAYLSLKKSGVIDKDEDEGKKWAGPKNAHQPEGSSILLPADQAFVENSMPPVSLAVPAFDLSGFPFENKAYVMHRFDHIDEKSGEKLATREYFYADGKALLETVKAIASLEFLLDKARKTHPDLPALQTEVDRFVPVSTLLDEEKLPKNNVCLTVRPTAEDGTAPQYPVEVHFYAFDDVDEQGTSGTLGYLPGGRLAIAHEAFSTEGNYYEVLYRLVEDELALELIVHRSAPNQSPTTLYRRGAASQ